MNKDKLIIHCQHCNKEFSSLDFAKHVLEDKNNMKKEIQKTEKLLEKEKNLNQISFYEGYIKGLKFKEKELIKEIEELKEETRKETGAFKYDFCYDEIINKIK